MALTLSVDETLKTVIIQMKAIQQSFHEAQFAFHFFPKLNIFLSSFLFCFYTFRKETLLHHASTHVCSKQSAANTRMKHPEFFLWGSSNSGFNCFFGLVLNR